MQNEGSEKREKGRRAREACWTELDVIAVSSCWQCGVTTKPELSQG